VQIVDVDFSIGYPIAHFIGFAIGEARFHSASRHPGAEAFGLVFAAMLINGGGAAKILAPRGSAEFTRPQNECIFKKATLFQIFEQSSDRLIRTLRIGAIAPPTLGPDSGSIGSGWGGLFPIVV